MPKSCNRSSVIINYQFQCGLVKNQRGREDRQLKLFYKLHQKKCSVCASVPFIHGNNTKKSEHKVQFTKTKEDIQEIVRLTNGMTKKKELELE